MAARYRYVSENAEKGTVQNEPPETKYYRDVCERIRNSISLSSPLPTPSQVNGENTQLTEGMWEERRMKFHSSPSSVLNQHEKTGKQKYGNRFLISPDVRCPLLLSSCSILMGFPACSSSAVCHSMEGLREVTLDLVCERKATSSPACFLHPHQSFKGFN